MDECGIQVSRSLFRARVHFLVLVSVLVSFSLGFGSDTETVSFLTEREQTWLKAHPVIRLAPDPKFQPIEFFDNDGTYSGIGADYVELINQKLGVRFEIVRCNNWDEVLEKARSREVDVLNAVVKTPQRETFMRFPSPYLSIPSVIIVRKQVDRTLKMEMLEGMHVVMVSGYGYVDLLRNKYPDIKIELVSDLTAALRKVSFGMADAFVGDLATASFYIEQEGITNLRLAGETDPPNVSGFAVRSDWPELCSILEKGIARINEEERATILNRWIRLGSEPGVTVREFKLVMVIIAVAVTVVIAGFLLWNRMLKQAVHSKTEDLRREIDERRQAEQALAESKAHLSTLLKTIPDLVWLKDPDGVYLACNAKFERFFGASEEEILGKTDYDFVDKELADFFRRHDVVAMNAGKPCINEETVTYADDGHKELLETIKTPVYEAGGQLIGVLGIARDITDRKRAEDDRLKLQDQLVQAQKLESVGRLAGGVAHDFNNMLSIIMGYAEIGLEAMSPGNPNYQNFQEIISAAKRSSDIVRQLLAYARKQTIEPMVLDLNAAIGNTLKMLRRLIGENIHLIWKPGSELWPVKMDPSQIDQLLANLVANARDSIDDVGTIVIETQTVTIDEAYSSLHTDSRPGDYVMIAVGDNGKGMDKETLANIFEPFFTTKQLGKGTGLGLSTIYGIVKQNQGFINVYSEKERGSTFKLYIPRCQVEAEDTSERPEPDEAPTGNETVMIVEDEPMILNLGTTMLETLGYVVLSALTPDSAIQQAEAYDDEIHLLITDVVMPKMNGRDLEKLVKTFYPNLKSLFMSGYTANAIAHHGVIDEGVHFIHKPFSKKELAVKIREVLG